jgi:hypothetical protein
VHRLSCDLLSTVYASVGLDQNYGHDSGYLHLFSSANRRAFLSLLGSSGLGFLLVVAGWTYNCQFPDAITIALRFVLHDWSGSRSSSSCNFGARFIQLAASAGGKLWLAAVDTIICRLF